MKFGQRNLPQIFAWWDSLLCFLSQKDFVKKYGAEGSISNFYLGLFYPNNQVILFGNPERPLSLFITSR